jgi:hypothetical protein
MDCSRADGKPRHRNTWLPSNIAARTGHGVFIPRWSLSQYKPLLCASRSNLYLGIYLCVLSFPQESMVANLLTFAASALSILSLPTSRTSATSLVLFGSGEQAKYHTLVLCALVLTIRRATIVPRRDTEWLSSLVEELQASLGSSTNSTSTSNCSGRSIIAASPLARELDIYLYCRHYLHHDLLHHTSLSRTTKTEYCNRPHRIMQTDNARDL